MSKIEICIVNVSNMWVYSFCDNKEEAENKLQEAIKNQHEDIKSWEKHCKNYPDVEKFKTYLSETQNKKYQIMTYNEFLQAEKDYYTNQPLTEITVEKFENMLNVLPPLKWCTINNIEMFCISEMITGSYTIQYIHDKNTDKYYRKTVDITDRTTWGHNFIK